MPIRVKGKFPLLPSITAVRPKYAELSETEISADSLDDPYDIVRYLVHPDDLLPLPVRRTG
jgi:hypothetical protein